MYQVHSHDVRTAAYRKARNTVRHAPPATCKHKEEAYRTKQWYTVVCQRPDIQQRISIARAVLKNAPILILDEATAYADPDNEVRIQEALAALAKDKTVILIAHRLSTVAGADRIFVLKDGKIAESGSLDDLQKQGGIFAEMMMDYASSIQWKVEKEAIK